MIKISHKQNIPKTSKKDKLNNIELFILKEKVNCGEFKVFRSYKKTE